MFFLLPLAALQEPVQEPALALSESALHPAGSARGSAFPSWLVSAGAPRLVFTSLGEGSAARLELAPPALAAPLAEAAPQPLAEGTDWLLNWADFPAAAELGDGTRLATWLVLDAGHEHSYATRFSVHAAGGGPATAARPLEEHRGPGEHGFVSLAPLDDARFLALWLDGRAAGAHGDGDTHVYARTIGRDGELGPEQLVDGRACSCCPTALVRLADGTHLAAWRDRSPEELRDVALARFDGTRWSEPELLHADGWRIDGCPVNGPRLAAGPERVAATWYTGADGSVRVSLAGRDGRGFGAPLRVDDGAPEGRGDLAFLPDGSVLVGWMEHEPNESSWRVRRVTAAGELGPSLVVAHVSSERASGFLRMTSDPQGVLLAYTETGAPRRVAVRRVGLR
jgi:hypothetical protein